MAAAFVVYKDKNGSWRWRLRANNNQTVASSGESFSSKQAAIAGTEACRAAAAASAGYVEETEESLV